MRSINTILILLVCLGSLLAGPVAGARESRTELVSSEQIPVSGMKNPEDLIRLPGTRWVIVSSMRTKDGIPGHLYGVDTEHGAKVVALYPTETKSPNPDTKAARSSSEPPDPRQFFPHGINVVRLKDGTFQLDVVNHGGREAIELFRLTVNHSTVKADWIGCVPLPPHSFGNGLGLLPQGGFVVSNMFDPSDPAFIQKFAAGAATGGVLEWTPEKGWRPAVTQTLSGANGVETSPDGRWLYVCEWAARRLWKFSLHGEGAPESVAVDFLPDNMRWTDRGTLLVTGQNSDPASVFHYAAHPAARPIRFTVIEVKPDDLTQHQLLQGGDENFGGGTGAILVGHELWVGSFYGDKVARYVPTMNRWER